MLAIWTRDLTKIYRRSVGKRVEPALDALDFEIGDNEVFGFLGRNGAGKTTTIKILCSLLKPSRGEALIFNETAQRRSARRHIGYLPENPYFYEYLSPRETLDFYGHLNGMNRSQRRNEWEKIANLLDLHGIADQRVRDFSKGMRQRLGFASALVGDPKLLILDEPMSGLDPIGRRQIRELILRMRDEKKTIFFSSHVLSDVEQICDRVGILVKGKLMVEGRIEELLSDQIHQVEVIIRGLDPASLRKLTAQSDSLRQSEAGYHFLMRDLDAANTLVHAAQDLGGKLVEFNPVKQSLEDYFMNRQEARA